MMSAVEIADQVSDLEKKIAEYDYKEAKTIFDTVKNKPGIYQLRDVRDLEEELEQINPENIFLKRTRQYLLTGFPPENTAFSEQNKHKELVTDLFGLCFNDTANKAYKKALAEVILCKNELSADQKLLKDKLSSLADFSREFDKFELPIKSYESLAEKVLDYAVPLKRAGTYGRPYDYVDYEPVLIIGDLLDVNEIAVIPENLKKKIKKDIFEKYEQFARESVNQDSATEIIRESYLMDDFFNNAEKHNYTILNPSKYYESLSDFAKPLSESELKEQRLQEEKIAEHPKNLATAQQYLTAVTDSLIPRGKYTEAYQTILKGRQILMEGGIKNDEGPLLSEFERLGSEITNLMRK